MPAACVWRRQAGHRGVTLNQQPTRFAAEQGRAFRLRATCAAVALLAATCGAAHAMELNTGNQDLSVRFDNTIRYNYAQRVENRDPKIGNSALYDEGDYSFNKGATVANRLDLLSELDVVYAKRYGFRVSGAAWADGAYGSTSKSNPNPPLVNIPSYVNHQYTPYIKRYYEGPSGEWLDAFVFGGADIGNVPVNAKLGRHSIYWGESLFLGGNLHSVAYAQSPLDLQKAFATPGVEAKELFRPLNQLSAQAQVTDTVSVAGNYMLDWEANRFPEGGTYLGPVDFLFNGPQRQFLPAPFNTFATNNGEVTPKKRGDFGLSARWSPAVVDGTFGFYYRRFTDKIPQALITSAAPPAYNLIYADGIDLWGASFAKNIAGVSFGAEVSTRHNTPLNSQVLGVAIGLPSVGDTKGARGDTYHALMNAAGVVSKTPVFDAATWVAEVQWSEWSKVTSGANLFNAIGFAPCNATATAPAKDKWDGCVTKQYVGTSLGFTPTWYQVFPGVDLSAPISYAVGLHGNAATSFGGNEGLGNYSIGLGADVQQKYRFDLKYIDYVGHYRDNGVAVTSTNGFTTALKDRGFVSLTFKTTF
jgi:hypothetical protein